MHFLLPLAFTLSPTAGYFSQLPWLTLSVGIVLFPLLEWRWRGHAAQFLSRGFGWGIGFPRAIIALVIVQSLLFALQADQFAWPTLIWLALSCGYVAGASGIVLAHELGHRRALTDRTLARGLLLILGYGHYAIEHNRGHHRGAASFSDPATARRHEGLWQFLPRYYSGVLRDGVKLSRAAPGKLNEALALLSVTAGLFLLIWHIASWQGLVFCVLQAATAQLLVGAVDYVEHWGLERKTIDGKLERMGPHHTWDCANPVADALLFNLPRHASHHIDPSRNCDELQRTPTSPQMPTGYAGMVLLAMVPPLYKKVMTPRLPVGQ
jgi:alkane 1-monooxygenase